MSFGSENHVKKPDNPVGGKKEICPRHGKEVKELVEVTVEVDGVKYLCLCCRVLSCGFLRIITPLPENFPHTVASGADFKDLQQQVNFLRKDIVKLAVVNECKIEMLRLQIAASAEKK